MEQHLNQSKEESLQTKSTSMLDLIKPSHRMFNNTLNMLKYTKNSFDTDKTTSKMLETKA